METNMKATLCEHTLDNAYLAYPNLRGAILHSDRGTQYTSETYRKALAKYGMFLVQNSFSSLILILSMIFRNSQQ